MAKRNMVSAKPLLDYLEEKNATFASVGRKLKVSGQCISNWKKEGKMPLDKAQKLNPKIEGNVIHMQKDDDKSEGSKNFQRSDEVHVLEKYMEAKNITAAELSRSIGYSTHYVSQCIANKDAPAIMINHVKLLLQQNRKSEQGDLFVCYVPQAQREAFTAICKGLTLDAKKVL